MPVKLVYTAKFLRGHFGYNLNWHNHVENISKKTASGKS